MLPLPNAAGGHFELCLVSLVWALFAFSMRVTSKTSLLPFLFSLAATLYLFIPSCAGSKVIQLPEQEPRHESTHSEEFVFAV